MARPKKNQLPEQPVADSTPEVKVVTQPVEDINLEVKIEEPQAVVPSTVQAAPPPITPEADAREMDRYFRVINNSEAASRISTQITHQRELQFWGVHQYDNASRNTFARSFYFKELRNAQYALEAAQKLV
jgi:hypothetical protein